MQKLEFVKEFPILYDMRAADTKTKKNGRYDTIDLMAPCPSSLLPETTKYLRHESVG